MTPTVKTPTIKLTEPCGTIWTISHAGEGSPAHRTYWVLRTGGPTSEARPGVVGFYAQSIDDAFNNLTN